MALVAIRIRCGVVLVGDDSSIQLRYGNNETPVDRELVTALLTGGNPSIDAADGAGGVSDRDGLVEEHRRPGIGDGIVGAGDDRSAIVTATAAVVAAAADDIRLRNLAGVLNSNQCQYIATAKFDEEIALGIVTETRIRIAAEPVDLELVVLAAIEDTGVVALIEIGDRGPAP